MTIGDPRRKAYRCKVVPECSAGRLSTGWRTYPVRVMDTSRDAFTLEVKPRVFRRLKEGCHATLDFNGERWEVEYTAVFQQASRQYFVSMARVRDLTSSRGPRTSLRSLWPAPNPTADPALPMAMLIAFLVACLALPGMGDRLGTAPKIRHAIQTIWQASLGR